MNCPISIINIYVQYHHNHKEVPVGLLNAILGNASEVDASALQQEYARLFAEGERVEKGYKLVRDVFMFTNMRLILVDSKVSHEKG